MSAAEGRETVRGPSTTEERFIIWILARRGPMTTTAVSLYMAETYRQRGRAALRRLIRIYRATKMIRPSRRGRDYVWTATPRGKRWVQS